MPPLTTKSQEGHFFTSGHQPQDTYLKHGRPKTYTKERIQIFSSFDFLPLL